MGGAEVPFGMPHLKHFALLAKLLCAWQTRQDQKGRRPSCASWKEATAAFAAAAASFWRSSVSRLAERCLAFPAPLPAFPIAGGRRVDVALAQASRDSKERQRDGGAAQACAGKQAQTVRLC